MRKPLFNLAKVNVTDTYVLADIFDEEKYFILEQSDNLKDLVSFAVDGFFHENPQIKSYKQWLTDAEDGGSEFIIHSGFKEIFRASTILLSREIFNALLLTLKYHGGQKRKGDDHPYLEHPLEVAWLLWKRGFASDIIAAGYCHDLLEDSRCTEEEIEKACGREVLEIVKAVTNDKALTSKADWELKKAKYIKTVEAGGEKAIAVSIADKITNMNAFLAQYEKEGSSIWKRFNRGRDKKIWFEEEVLKMASKNWNNPLLKEYSFLINKFKLTKP